MLKNYFYIFLFFSGLLSSSVFAQDTKPQSGMLESLGFYPNPASNGKIYITSKTSLDKEVTVFDVLGKKVIQAFLTTKELNIASLLPGIYIINIREGEATTTRKLIVK